MIRDAVLFLCGMNFGWAVLILLMGNWQVASIYGVATVAGFLMFRALQKLTVIK